MRTNKYTRRTLVIEIIMLILSLIIIIPLLVVVFGSFKTAGEAARFNFKPPAEWLTENYSQVIEKANLVLAMKNSTIITVCVVAVTSIVCALGAFIIGRRKDRLSSFLNTFFSLGLIVPMCIVPTLLLLNFLHINNSNFPHQHGVLNLENSIFQPIKKA